MHFSEIRLGDFGCFVEARIGNLEDGLTVIGGPQRAGKTTFMHAIRQFGYGIGQGDDLPPPSDRYDLSATVDVSGDRYRLDIDHFADPSASSLDPSGPDRTPRELFGGMRQEQYRQLYTISLDELRRHPESMGDDVDLARVLLGAGYGDAKRLPDLIEDLGSAAYDIGRTTGRRGGAINDAISVIEDGVDDRTDAIEHVETYRETSAELNRVEHRIESIRTERATLEREHHRLGFVLEEYETYERLETLRQSIDDVEPALESFPLADLDRVDALTEQYTEIRETLRDAEAEFETEVRREDPTTYRQHLLDAKSDIEHNRQHLERYRGEVEEIERREDDLSEMAGELRRRISDAHPDWSELSDVREQDLNIIAVEDLRERVHTYRETNQQIENAQEAIEKCTSRIDALETRIESAAESDSSKSRSIGARAIIAIGFAVVAGGVASLIHPIVGVLITAGLLIATGVWLLDPPGSPKHDGVDVQHLRAQQQELETTRVAERERLEGAEATLDELESDFEDLRARYNLPAETHPSTIETLVVELRDLRRAIDTYDSDMDRLESDRGDLEAELTTVLDRLVHLGVTEMEVSEPIDGSRHIFEGIERASEHLDVAERLDRLETECKTYERDLASILAKGLANPPDPGDTSFPDALETFRSRGAHLQEAAERQETIRELESRLSAPIRDGRLAESFEPIVEETPLQAFQTVVRSYESSTAIEDRIEAIATRLDDLADEIEELRDQRVNLKHQLEQLKSDEDILDAHRDIQRGRADLEGHLEDYAQYRIAEHLLERLQEQYLERTTGELLVEASNIFSRITNGAYTAVESTGEFENLDFRALLDDDAAHATSELSRATAEQLFLAVRLARIRLEEEPLPVLIDDSLTNFDPGHVHRTLEVIGELAERHQVFLLTCHPQMLDHVASFHKAQYYTLEDGKFDGPVGEPTAVQALLAEASPL